VWLLAGIAMPLPRKHVEVLLEAPIGDNSQLIVGRTRDSAYADSAAANPSHGADASIRRRADTTTETI
jgi:hypothetical protein